jgi:elongator complex protein 4
LDDVLGGGHPLTSTFLVSAPDPHSSYGDLVLKYNIAQGLVSGHDICIIGESAKELVELTMWKSSSSAGSSSSDPNRAEQDDDTDSKIKIAWRYEHMKQFKTTVSSTTS